jgi:hypothetical protein
MKSVTLIASRTIDHINDLDKSATFTRPGGPALYSKGAIEALGYRVHLVTSARPAAVRVTIKNRCEKIRVDRIGKISIPKRLPTQNVVLSPILDEIDLRQLNERDCRIFLDAQGYFRTKGSDRLRRWICSPRLVRNVLVLKVNQPESSHVSEEILALFRSRVLLITRGREGVEIWDHGRRRVVRGHPVKSSNTLGAGDVFFGSFVATYMRSGDVLSAGRLAVQKAEELLERK